MKINTFNMRTFGPFTDKRIDFSAIENGLHVVYGQNEAGKSTSLRALITLLYGFEHRVPDDWLHDTNKLAVSGTLALNSGETLPFTRYKRRKNDLINDDTGQPFDQSILNQFLAGKTRDDFKNAYGISHDSLRHGVESVLASGGELGQTLFTATSGLNVLKDVLTKLEEKQSKLFAPRAQKASINAGISSLAEQRKKIREVSTSHTQWKKMKKELEQLEEKKQQIEARLSDLSKTISTDTRYRDALNHVSHLQQVEQELESLASIPELSEDFPQRRIQAQAAIKESQQAQDILQTELETILKQMNALSFDDNILSHQELIESLASEIAVHAKENIDSKTLRAKIHQTNRDAEASLKLLGQELSVDNIEPLRLSKPSQNKLKKQVSQHTRLEQAAETANKDLKDVIAKLKSIKDQLLQTGQPAITTELQGCLDRVAEQGNLEARLSEAKAETTIMQARIDKELAALGLWHGDLDAFEKLAMPTEETMRQYAGRLDQLRQSLTTLENEIQRTRKDIGDKQDELDEVTRNKELPNPEDLLTQRNFRDQGWRSVRSVWLEGGEFDQGFLSKFPEQISLADAYEQSVRDADNTADILRNEAQDVAVAQTLRSQILELEKSCHAIEQQRQALTQQQQNALAQWQALWQPLGISALSPAEMIEWSGRVGQIKRNADDYHEKVAKLKQLETAVKGSNSDLIGAFNRLAVNVPDNISHASLVDLARHIIKENNELAKQRKELELRDQEFGDRKQEIVKKIEEIEEQKQQWSKQWESAMLPLKLSAATQPDEAMDYIDALDEVFVKLDDVKATQQRIDAMDRNRKGFQERVQDAAARLSPQLTAMESVKVAAMLKGLLTENLQRRQQYKLLETDQRKKTAQLAKEKEKLAGNQEILHQLCAEASASDPEQLSEVERQSRRKSLVLKDAAAVKDRLAELAAGQTLPAFIEIVRQQDPDVLTAGLEKAETDKAELTNEREGLVAGIAVAQSELNRFDGQSQAAGLAVEADGLAGRIKSDVEHYVKLRLASVVLAKAIERYRKHNESPVLEAAGNFFQTLTTGSFIGLKADFNDRGEPVLKAIRAADNMALSIEALSDGTRDQLFLALRLGGLSRHIENSGRVPFIVDDVLVHFDDERSSAALQAMASLAKKTQIIFFTHHNHLVDLAQKTVPSELMCSYCL